jgi:hypothetical protein
MLVLVPEIPYVTKKIQSLCFLGKTAQKLHKTTLPVDRIRHPKSQVNI